MSIFEEIWLNATPIFFATPKVAQTVEGTKRVSSQYNVYAIIIGCAVVISLVFVAYYVMSKIKRSATESEPTLSEHLTKFQEAQTDGSMTREEYAQVREHLSVEITHEVKSSPPVRFSAKK